ncbi:hypothetical protein D3C84_1260590 [compost metagenome]
MVTYRSTLSVKRTSALSSTSVSNASLAALTKADDIRSSTFSIKLHWLLGSLTEVKCRWTIDGTSSSAAASLDNCVR